MINNVVLVSGVQQSDSVIHIHVSILFQILFPFRLLQNMEQSSLCYTVGPCWLFFLKYKFLFLYLKIYLLFMYLFLAVSGLSCSTRDLCWGVQDLSLWRGLLVVVHGLLSSCRVQAPGRVSSVVVAHGLSCPEACGILVPWPGIEPPSPAL